MIEKVSAKVFADNGVTVPLIVAVPDAPRNRPVPPVKASAPVNVFPTDTVEPTLSNSWSPLAAIVVVVELVPSKQSTVENVLRPSCDSCSVPMTEEPRFPGQDPS